MIDDLSETINSAIRSSGDILFIDDDPRAKERYDRPMRDAGFNPHFVRGPDQALNYLMRSETNVDLIVWDMMLPAGETFRHINTESGLSTGRFLYPAMRVLRPHAYYILLTGRGNVSLEDFDSPEDRSYVFIKGNSSIEYLVDFIQQLMAGI